MEAKTSPRRLAALRARIVALVRAIDDGDDSNIEAAILRLSRSRKVFAPLGLAVGAFVMLFQGVKLIVSNWRLTLVQIVPAMWIWLAMYDLKAHVLRGRTLRDIRGLVLIPLGLIIVAITVASFFLNAVFAFAIAQGGPPQIRRAFEEARRHLTPIVISGSVVGVMLAVATLVAPRWQRPWFVLCLGIVVGIMMVCYVAVPSRLVGMKRQQSRRDKLFATAIGGALSATVCTPPYVLGRVGLLMLGSKVLLIPGIFVFAAGITLQAGATGAVRAIKMSASLTSHESSTHEPR
jgi:hypothetical protein